MGIKLQVALSSLVLISLVACGEEKTTTANQAEQAPVIAQAVEPKQENKQTATGILSPYKTKQVAPHTYVIHGPTQMPNKANSGFMNNPGFIVTEKSVAVIDPGSSVHVGRELVNRIKEVTPNPVTHVFVSHIHGDHWLANHGIKEAFPDAKFFAHPVMIEKANAGDAEQWVELMKNLTENATEGTEAVIPGQVLEHLQEVKVDDITVRAHIGEKAHTTTDVMYEVIEDKVLFTGDNITYKRIPRMTDGSFVGNISAADYGLGLPVDTVVPGHGPTGAKEVIKSYRNYLSTVYETSRTLAEEGMETYEMKPTILEKLSEYLDWPGIEDQVGKHISLSVLEAEEAAF